MNDQRSRATSVLAALLAAGCVSAAGCRDPFRGWDCMRYQADADLLQRIETLDLKALAHTFTLRTSDGFVENFGPALIARAAAEAPGVRLRFIQKTDRDSAALRDGGVDLETIGRPLFAESTFRGVGFGLGFSTVVDATAGRVLTSPGEYAWGGMASTAFYVDPVEDVTAMFFTQFVPSSAYPIRSRLRTLVQQALVDRSGRW